MTLTINGERRDFADGASLEQIVESLGLPVAAVLLEHNGDALRRDEWSARTVRDADQLEIIRIVAGG